MTIRVVVTVPEGQPGSVEVRAAPVDGQPWPEHNPSVEIAPGETKDFTVWGAKAIQVSEKPLG